LSPHPSSSIVLSPSRLGSVVNLAMSSAKKSSSSAITDQFLKSKNALAESLRRDSLASQVDSNSNTANTEQLQNNFKSLGIDMDAATIARMEKLGLITTISSVAKTADVIEKRRESKEKAAMMDSNVPKEKKPKSLAVTLNVSTAKDPNTIDAHRIRTLLIDLNSPGGNIHSKSRMLLDGTLSMLESCFYRQQEQFVSVLFQKYSIKSKHDVSRLPGRNSQILLSQHRVTI
jgi:hypothetical protein